MATEFTAIRPYVRAILGDTDAARFIYGDGVIDSHIQLFSFCNNAQFPLSSEEDSFAADLTPDRKARVILETARSIVSPKDNSFLYKTPILTVSRSGGTLQLIGWIDRALRQLLAKTLIASSNEFDAIFQGPERFCLAIDNAITGIGTAASDYPNSQ